MRDLRTKTRGKMSKPAVSQGRVAIVGDLVTDVLALAAGPLRIDSDTPARIRMAGGGAGANTAAWLAALGMPVTLVCAVGDDDTGRTRISELAPVEVTAQL